MLHGAGKFILYVKEISISPWLFGMGMTLRLGKVEVMGRLTPAHLKFGLKAVNFAFWLHSWWDALSHFACIFLWLSLSWIRIFGSPRIACSSQHRYHSFLSSHRILGCLWCCCDLCALRMRQWREQTLLSIVSNQIRGLIHLKMRPILEAKTNKEENKTGGGCFMLLLSAATFSKKNPQEQILVCLFVIFIHLGS